MRSPITPRQNVGGGAGGPRSLVPSCTGTNAQGQTSFIGQGERSHPPPPPPTQPPALPDAHELFASHANQPPKIHIKGLLRATANGNVSPGTAAAEQRGVEGKQQRSGLRCTGGSPLRTAPGPPQPALPAVPPSRTPGPLVPSRRSVYKYRGDSAWLLPPPPHAPPRTPPSLRRSRRSLHSPGDTRSEVWGPREGGMGGGAAPGAAPGAGRGGAGGVCYSLCPSNLRMMVSR